MEDMKLFYKDILQRDITILRTAANTLEALKHRWPNKTQIIEELGVELVEISKGLLAEGWNGYVPKPIAEIAIDDTLELIAAAKEEEEALEVVKVELAKQKADAKLLKENAEFKAKRKAELEAEIADLEVE